MRTNKIWLVCTGLGRINRGFETHAFQLANLLSNSNFKNNVVLFSGKEIECKTGIKNTSINCLHRNHWLVKLLFNNFQSRFLVEQISFFLVLFPYLIFSNPKLIYLGEYELYCYLYKFRKVFNLKFSLCLHTGGMAVPGLFNKQLDFIHHITPYLKKYTIQYPADRQFNIPHFLDTTFDIEYQKVQKIKNLANGKLIWLSVGSIDTHFKRMDLLCELLGPFSNKIFPIILGETTGESQKVIDLFNESFGANGYYIGKVPRLELGSYYSAADAFILCTEIEPFGLVFLEAAYFGLPILCNDNEVIRQILPEGVHYINMSDLNICKAYINALLETEFAFNKNSLLKDFVIKSYSINTLSDKYLTMFKSMTEFQAALLS